MAKLPFEKLLLACVLISAAEGYGIQVVDETLEGNSRFTSGFTTDSPVQNTDPSFVGAGYDWSGIGWAVGTGVASASRLTNAAMVSPLHAFSARHQGIWLLGSHLRLVSESGNVIDLAFTSNNSGIPNPGASHDINITGLERSLLNSEGVTPLRMLDVASNNYVGMEAFVMGSHNKTTGQIVAETEITTVTPWPGSSTLNVAIYPSNPSVSFMYWEGGDSGSPVLIRYNNTLTIAGSAWTAYGMAGSLLSTQSTYNPVKSVNEFMAPTGYALRWTIYDNPDDTANTAPVWTGASVDFAQATNWSNSVVPNLVPVVFDSGDTGAAHALSLNQNAAVRGILFRDSSSTDGYSFSGSSTLSIGTSGIQNHAAATQVFNVPIALAGAQNWEAVGGDLVANGNIANNGYLLVIQGGKDTVLNGVISGTGALAKDEAGVLSLGGANTYSGGTFIHDGTVKALVDGAIPTGGTVIFDTGNPGATLDVNGKSLVFANIMSVRDGLGIVNLNDGSITIGGGNASTSFAGSFTGGGLVTKVGTGNITLRGDNSAWTGQFVAEGGDVVIAATKALGGGENVIKTGARLLTNENLVVQGDVLVTANQNSSGAMNAGYASSVVAAFGNATQVSYEGDFVLERTGTGTGLVKYAFQTAGSGAQTLRIDGNISTAGNTLGKVSLESWVQNSAAATVDFHGRISDAGGPALQVLATGIPGGTTMLSSESGNDFSGGVTAFAGTTLVISNSAGSATGTGKVEIRSSASLSGAGIIAPTGNHGLTVQANGRVAPGLGGIGTMTIDLSQSTGKANFQTGSTFLFDLAANHSSDQLVFLGTATGDVLFSSNLINFSVSGELSPGLYTLFRFDSAGAYSGNLVLGTGLEAYEVDLVYNSTNIQLLVVPEAGTSVLVFLGASALGLMRRKRKTSGKS